MQCNPRVYRPTQLDLTIERVDHLPIALEIRPPSTRAEPWHQRKKKACDIGLLRDPMVRQQLERRLEQVQPVPWGTDPDLHLAQLTEQLRQIACEVAPLKPKPKRTWVAEATWAHLQQARLRKAALKKVLKAASMFVQRLCWTAWARPQALHAVGPPSLRRVAR
eukprot:13462600-Alexandrium_andersonii.AAC.1